MEEIMNAVMNEAACAWEFAKQEASECWEDLKESTIVTKRTLVLGGIACFAVGVMACALCKPKQVVIEVSTDEKDDEEEAE